MKSSYLRGKEYELLNIENGKAHINSRICQQNHRIKGQRNLWRITYCVPGNRGMRGITVTLNTQKMAKIQTFLFTHV